ncbi:hypothetical protein Tco_0862249, partial [Tanacetum coccineum]
IRYALTQKALDTFCTKFHILEEVHPVLPNQNDTMHERHAGKIRLLFDEGGSGNQTEQGDFAGVGEGANIQPVVEVVAPVQPRRQGKRKSAVVDAGGVSHPPKRLREDHGTPVGVAAIPTLPFVTAFVSSTSECEVGDHTDSVAEPNLRTIGVSQRFVISSDSSHHSGPTIAEAEVDSLARSPVPIMTTVTTVTSTVDPALVAKEKYVKPSLFSADSSSGGGANPHTGSFQILMTVTSFVTNGSRLDDGHVCREMVVEFAPPKFFASVHGMEHDQLFTKFNVGAARQMCLSAEARDREIEDLKAQLLLREAKAAEAIRLRAEASNFKTKVKVDAPTQELNDGFVEVTRKQGKRKQNGKHQHIDGVQLTKPQPNYFYRVVSNPVNVNDEVSTSQPKGNREATSQPKSNVNSKASTSQPKEIKEASLQSNACSALEEDTGNPIDDLVDKTRKNVDVPLMKLVPKSKTSSSNDNSSTIFESMPLRSYGSKGLLPYGFERGDGWIADVGGLVCRFDVLEGMAAAAAVLGKRRGHVASFLAMERSKLLGKLLRDI